KAARHCRSYSTWRSSGSREDGIRNSVELVLIIPCLPAFALAPARSLFSFFSKKAVRFLLFRPFWLAARQSWRSRGFYSFANHHHGKESQALCLRSLVCFCCANNSAFTL